MSAAAALCATVAASVTPASSLAGVMSATGAVGVSLPAPAEQIDWRAYRRGHRPWHIGWRYGWPRYRIGAYASAAPAAPSSACSTFGVLGAASPTCDSWGVYGAGYPACSCWSVYNPY